MGFHLVPPEEGEDTRRGDTGARRKLAYRPPAIRRQDRVTGSTTQTTAQTGRDFNDGLRALIVEGSHGRLAQPVRLRVERDDRVAVVGPLRDRREVSGAGVDHPRRAYYALPYSRVAA